MADKLVPANDVVHVEIDPIGLPEKRRQEMSLETFQKLEQELFEASMNTALATATFAELDPGAEGPPEEWIRKFGEELATIRYRIAKAAWMCQSEAPVGLKFANATAIGILRVRAADKQPSQTLNYTVVELAVAPPQFPEKEVEGRK